MKKMIKPGSSKMLNMLAGSNNNFINKQDIFKSLKNFNQDEEKMGVNL